MVSSATGSSEDSHLNSPSSPFSNTISRSCTKTMEEVWREINLTSLSNNTNSNNTNTSTNTTTSPNFMRNMTLQDFLARPFANVVVSPTPDQPQQTQPMAKDSILNTQLDASADQFQLFCIENLNARPFVDLNLPNTISANNNNTNTTNVSAETSFSGGYPFEGLGSQSSPSSVVPPSAFGLERKRLPESDRDEYGGGDRRYKRMIKNRESAARSRARKQAYTNEIEITVKNLMEENARLRRQNEQLSIAAASQLPEKYKLSRSSTSPF